MDVNSMDGKPSDISSSDSPSSSRTAAEVVWPPHAHTYNEVDYVSGNSAIQHYERQHYEADERESPLVTYQETASPYPQPSGSGDSYAQVPLQSYVGISREAYRDSPVPSSEGQQYGQQLEPGQAEEMAAMSQVLDLHQSSRAHSPVTSSSAGPDSPVTVNDATMLIIPSEIVAHAGDRPLSLESQLSLAHSTLGLPVLLDKSNLAALAVDASMLQRGTITNQVLSHRYLLEQTQFLATDLTSQSLLQPQLTSRDTLPSILHGPSTSGHNVGSLPVNHKHMLAQKYAAELEVPSTSGGLGSDPRGHILEGIPDRPSSPYTVVSTSGNIIDAQAVSLYSGHQGVSMASGSGTQSLPIDVFVMDREVALVSSSRDSPEDLMGNVHHYHTVAHVIPQGSVQSYVSSSVDLVPSTPVDPGIHSTVDSTEGTKIHSPVDNIVDSSDGYVDTSVDDQLHTTSQGGYTQHLDLTSSDEASASSTVHSVLRVHNVLERNEALGTSHVLSSSQLCQAAKNESLDDLQSCSTVSSATHPDSTHSPGELNSSPLNSVQVIERPRRERHSSRCWCDDCGQFYERECTRHRVQLIVDKPVPTRAWASLPGNYLYVHKVHEQEDGPIYGVFAKKTIPKRTQFGPIEGLVLKKPDRPDHHFPLYIDKQDDMFVFLDTSDETMSNWMRFVRPAGCYKEQNVVLVQQGTNLYFNTTRAITPKNELRVWYSAAYAEQWNLPLLYSEEEERKALEQQENSWPCFECSKAFPTSEELQKHLNQHDEEELLVENGSSSRKKAHGRAKPPKKCHSKLAKFKSMSKPEEYQCAFCKKVFPRNYSLQRHLILHSGEKKYKCPLCELRFGHVYNRNRHVKRHQMAENKSVPRVTKSLYRKQQGSGNEWLCIHCNLTFDNPSLLNLHTLTHAAENVGMSDEIFNGSSVEDARPNSDLPMSEHSIEEESKPKCPECTQEFNSRRELIEHASVHGKMVQKEKKVVKVQKTINPLKPFKCSLCYKAFATDERLIKHYLVHGSEDAKPLKCDICNKRFLNNSALTCHIKVHSGEKKYYECPICRQKFDIIAGLKEHVYTHSENGIYTCPECKKTFEEYNQIRKHIRAFHSERRYPCDKCDKVFPRPDKLKLHLLRHSDHREFLCANCGKQFKRKDKLKEHMKRMHGPEREVKEKKVPKTVSSKKFVPKVSPTDYHRFIYKCHSCLLGFKRRGMLVNHLAKRHPDIRPDSVPELNLPILKTTRDYYCQYCEKVYRSSSKRKAHIIKNHPGAELPLSNRGKQLLQGVVVPGVPNPTFSQTVGSVTTHPHHCNWCHKQYASKAKLLQHQRKKHMDMLALSYVVTTKPSTPPSKTEQIIITPDLSNVLQSHGINAEALVIDTTKRKLHLTERDGSTVIMVNSQGEADLLTQAMSELTQQPYADFRAGSGEFLAARLQAEGVTTSAVVQNAAQNQDTAHIVDPSVDSTNTTLDQVHITQLLAQYQQQSMSPVSIVTAPSSGPVVTVSSSPPSTHAPVVTSAEFTSANWDASAEVYTTYSA